MSDPANQRYMCTSCGFIYDPADGDPDGGIAPGTKWEEIPDDWHCPDCGLSKSEFEMEPMHEPRTGGANP